MHHVEAATLQFENRHLVITERKDWKETKKSREMVDSASASTHNAAPHFTCDCTYEHTEGPCVCNTSDDNEHLALLI